MSNRQRKLTAEDYVNLPYSIVVEPDECDGKLCYMARHPELSGCMAQAWTPQEAVENLAQARRDYVLIWAAKSPGRVSLRI